MKLAALLLLFPATLFANNLHLIDSSDQNGFAIYRMGKPDESDTAELCKLGIQEVMVLSGDAKNHEYKYQSACPTLKVVYDTEQSVGAALDRTFLDKFDKWVQEAQVLGKKIAFRCSCGCHRTGRLAAYYQMKYQNLTKDDATAIMNEHGKVMFFHPSLKPQVQALRDYIKGSPCTVEAKYCVR
jgi:protein-tyrosine phosphatase